jgi:CRISPR/Cas system-associated exonuclease Cas4 (RecB family)
VPYIYVTWLAKTLGGARCLYRPWFQSHFKYEKHEEMAFDLAKWNRDHNALMAARRKALDRDGWTCSVEAENSFKLQGASAVLAGKPDLVAVKGDRVMVIDGKSGRERDSDIWQVLLYLYAVPKSRPDLPKDIEGEVFYKAGNSVSLTTDALDDERMGQIVHTIRLIASDTAPPKTPSRDECRFCNIGPKDCPQRITEDQEQRTLVVEF